MPSFRIELHSHCQGDPVDTALSHTLYQHIDRAKEVGLDAIAITWHRGICEDTKAFAYARERGILVIPGIEADVEGQYHLLVLNVAPGDLPGTPTWAQIRTLRVRKPEVLVIAPHPFYPHPSCLGGEMTKHADCIDAVEWCGLHVNWLPAWVNPNLRAARWAQQYGKTLVACSDAHSLGAIGRNASTVEAEDLSIDSILAGIRAGRVSFQRRSLDFIPLVYATAKAMSSQPRHIARWVRNRIRNRARYPKDAPGLEVQS
jgi:predicted metal-dependent phosphoesterase TrpH